MNKYGHILAGTLFLLLVTASCEEPEVVVPTSPMKELVAGPGFRFELYRSLDLTVKMPIPASYNVANWVVNIWDENKDGQPGRLIKRGITDLRGTFSGKVNILTNTRKIFIQSAAGWRFLSLAADSTGTLPTNLFLDYNKGIEGSLPEFNQLNYETTLDAVRKLSNPLQPIKDNAVGNGDFSADTLREITNWYDPIQADGAWYATDGAKGMSEIHKEGLNSFARIMSDKFNQGGITQLINARPGQVISFTADVRGFDSMQDVHLYLIPRNSSGKQFDVFSYNLVNPGVDWTTGTIIAKMPAGTAYCQIMFYSASTGYVDFDNAAVIVYDPEDDADSDHVFDQEDEFPNDPQRAFSDGFPSADKPGTLAFEDGWPATGDFDYNDLVLDYLFTRICNSSGMVVQIDMTYSVRAVGSNANHGFGFQFYIEPELVREIQTNYTFTNSSLRINPNGTEMGQQWATFLLFDNGSALFPHTQLGSPTINTTLGYYFVVPEQYFYRIFLNAPAGPEKFTKENFNPFLFRSNDRSMETHLPCCPPTDLINPTFLGTVDDASLVVQGQWFRTKYGIPWALQIPVQFDYPVEQTDLLSGYLRFAEWVRSSGRKYPDWYLDKDGYRNWDMIYRW